MRWAILSCGFLLGVILTQLINNRTPAPQAAVAPEVVDEPTHMKTYRSKDGWAWREMRDDLHGVTCFSIASSPNPIWCIQDHTTK